MGLNNQGLGFTITAKDMASSVLRALGNQMSKLTAKGENSMVTFGDQISEVRNIAGTLTSVGTSILGVGVGATKMAMGFDSAMAQLRAVSQASAGDMKRLEAAAIQAGLATQFDPTQAAAALTDLAAAGFNVESSMKLLNPSLELAAGSLGQLTPSDAVGLASQAMKGFGISTDGAGMAVDQMLQATNMFALSAKDLPDGIGKISRGAGALKQSFEESVIAMGLAKNIIPSIDLAANAASTSMLRLANPEVQGQMKRLGVAVTDASGKFRPFLDVMADLGPKMAGMSDQKSAAFLIKAFGDEGLGGAQAIMKQLGDGITTTEGKLVKGADAVAYLRSTMAGAAGTAGKFAAELLNTLPGQMTLLEGSMSTLGVLVGKTFADLFKPVVEVVLAGINKVIAWVQKMPAGLKKAIAALTMVVGTVLTVAGAFMGAVAAFMAFSAAKAAIIAAIGAVGAGFVLLAAAIAPVIALGAAFYALWTTDAGGFATKITGFLQDVGKAFEVLFSLISSGTVSKSLLDDLQASSPGLANFAIQVYGWVERIKNFFAGIGEGFSAAMDAAKPAFDEFKAVLSNLTSQFGFAAEGPEKAKDRFTAFGEAGATTGRVIGRVVTAIVVGATYLAAAADTAVAAWKLVAPTFDSVVASAGIVMTAIGALIGAFIGADSQTSQTTSTFRVLGGVVAFVAGIIATTFTQVAAIIGAAIHALSGFVKAARSMLTGVGEVISGLVDTIKALADGDWAGAWDALTGVVRGWAKTVVSMVGAVMEGIAGAFDSLMSAVGKKSNLKGTVVEFQKSATARLDAALGGEAMQVKAGAAAAVKREGTDKAGVAAPGVGPVALAPGMSLSDIAQLISSPSTARPAPAAAGDMDRMQALAASFKAGTPPPPAPTLVTVQSKLMLDEQVIADVVQRVQANNDARGFGPTPTQV